MPRPLKRPAVPPVKRFAEERGLPVFQPASLKREGVRQELSALSPNVIVVAAYGRIIPPDILGLPPLGCVNVHPSLLPRYRGPSPVATAVLNGDAVTGVTIMKLDEGMDTGPILAARETRIEPDEMADALTARLFEQGASLLVETLPMWATGKIEARPQDSDRATTTRLLSKEDGEIDWGVDAARIARQVRAFYPWPGTYTRWAGRLLKVLEAHAAPVAAPSPAPTAEVVLLPDGGLAVRSGDGMLVIDRLQLEGRRAATAAQFLLGHPDFVGARLGS